MRPFDANDYRGRVLAPIHARGGAEHSDPFEIYDIPLDEVATLGDAAVAARIDEVWAFWQRSRDHPRYRGVVLALLARHGELTDALRTQAARGELAARVASARAEREGERFAVVDAAAARLVERFGGLPEDKIPGLRRIARDAGLGDDEFERWIARHPRVGAGAAERTTRRPVPPDVLRQVRSDLQELGRILGEDPPRSLFELLNLSPGTDRDTIRAVRDEALARNRARRPDRRRALLDDLFAAVTALLVDGDPEAYLDGLAAAAADLLRPRLAAAVLVEDRLLAADAAALVAAAESEGLDQARAVAVVRALAREAGVDETVVTAAARGGHAGLPAGSRAQARTAPRVRLTRPGADEWDGAGAGHTAASGPPPDWQDVLTLARAALDAGTPIAASDLLARALEIAGSRLPPIRALGEEIEAAIRRASGCWSDLTRAVADRRLEEASRLVGQLATTGRDVPGPEGADLDAVSAAVEAGRRRAAALLAAAAAAPATERAAVALEALGVVADSAEAHALLTENLVPPSALVVMRGSGAVEIQWAPSPTPGARYRVTRVAADGASRTVGMTQATFIEDGGVPAGAELPGYEVRAGIGGAWSAPAVWPTPADGQAEGALAEQAAAGPGPAGSTTAGSTTAAGTAQEAADADRTQLIARTPADALEPAYDLATVGGKLRWTWPDGCTEVIVAWRADAPPIAANDPAAQSRKVTNTRYELDGGLALPPARPLHVAVFGCLRDRAGHLIVASTAAPTARRLLQARDRL